MDGREGRRRPGVGWQSPPLNFQSDADFGLGEPTGHEMLNNFQQELHTNALFDQSVGNAGFNTDPNRQWAHQAHMFSYPRNPTLIPSYLSQPPQGFYENEPFMHNPNMNGAFSTSVANDATEFLSSRDEPYGYNNATVYQNGGSAYAEPPNTFVARQNPSSFLSSYQSRHRQETFADSSLTAENEEFGESSRLSEEEEEEDLDDDSTTRLKSPVMSTPAKKKPAKEEPAKERKGLQPFAVTEAELVVIRDGYEPHTATGQHKRKRRVCLTLSEYTALMQLRKKPFSQDEWNRHDTFPSGPKRSYRRRNRVRVSPSTPYQFARTERASTVAKKEDALLKKSPRPHRAATKERREHGYGDIFEDEVEPKKSGNGSNAGMDYSDDDSDFSDFQIKTPESETPPMTTSYSPVKNGLFTTFHTNLPPTSSQPPIPIVPRGTKVKQGKHRFDHGQIQEHLTRDELRQIRPGYGVIPALHVKAFDRPQNPSLASCLGPRGPNPEMRRIRITVDEWTKLWELRGEFRNYEKYYKGRIPYEERMRGNANLERSLARKRQGITYRAKRDGQQLMPGMKKLRDAAEKSAKVKDEEGTETAVKDSDASQQEEPAESSDAKVKEDETYDQEQDAHYDIFDDIYDAD
ncbi:hypothetical protein M7I_8022 [Glarea lozoyensis 74030]|nr:hypothetical protein M7I_8022 [Glarea lozoyensis 74030]